MQYVGKLVSSVYTTITPNINPATLSGAIDVIVVERPITTTETVEVDENGTPLPSTECGKLPEHERRYKEITKTTTELASTPFHVRFGKMSVLRPGERKVTLHLNESADPLPFAMKLGESGEAFFVVEIDDEDERNNIPADLVTSPILSAASSPIAGPEDGGDGGAQDGGSAEVEPLELGEAETPINIDVGGNEDEEANTKEQQLQDNKKSGGPEEQGLDSKTSAAPTKAAEAVAAPPPRQGKTYAKTLRLTSDQLKSLNLRKGANSITFSVTSSYSGVATCSARIFLWESTYKIVVSDIDGTITKSDALGHVFTMIGRDWTHIGLAKLYTDIARNGYRIMYLTSRAIGQADSTRDYLKGIRQNGYQLPDGPVIMSPDRLITSLHREVILRKPEVFKMAVLRDIVRLFGADPGHAHSQPGGALRGIDAESVKKADAGANAHDSPSSGAATAAAAELDSSSTTPESRDQRKGLSHSMSSPALASLNTGTTSTVERKEDRPTPFYAGFGNRITDALSYRSVNIPSSRIFTIDTYGEVKMELLELAGYKSSYIHMADLVDQMFPPITAKEEKEPRKPEFNDFNYWRPAIAEVELPGDDELLADLAPVSPALSARSGKSVKSVRSATSDSAALVGGERGVAGTGTSGEEKASGSRLSRFGLGSLGLARKTVERDERDDRKVRASSAEPALQSSASVENLPSTSSWVASWRRRAASPDDLSQSPRATSPLVGPVVTAEPESEDEQFYDSEGFDDDNDDVSSLGGGGERSRLNSFGEDFDFDIAHARATTGRRMSGAKLLQQQQKQRQRSSEDEGEGDEADANDDEDVDDPLLETGEIRFDWKA